MNIHYDQKDGLGSVPDNQNVDYKGFKAWMVPDMFLKLARRIYIDPQDTSYLFLKNPIKRGKPIGSPFLNVNWDESKKAWTVWDHEGRHRVQVIKDLWPNESMEVHIFPGSGIRSRDITPDMLQSFMNGIMAQDKTFVKNPTSEVEWKGQKITPQQQGNSSPSMEPPPMLEFQKKSLNEISLVNSKDFWDDDIDGHIQEKFENLNLQNDPRKQEIENWFKTHFMRWILSSQDDNIKIEFFDKYKYRKGDDVWKRNKDVYQWTGMSFWEWSLGYNMDHIIDFFLTMPPNNINRIRGITFPQVFRLIELWDRQLSKKSKKEYGPIKFVEEGKDIKTLQTFTDGFRIVELLSSNARKEEGEIMGHCIGGGQYENSRNVSLRDKNGFPHATMQFANLGGKYSNIINQIKGKANQPIIEKYRPYIIDFITKNNLRISKDGENIGFSRRAETGEYEQEV